MNRSGHKNIKILQHRTTNWRESFTTCVAEVLNGKFSPSRGVVTLVAGTGPRILRTLDMFQRIQSVFHRQFAANCVHFSELSWWLDRNKILILRWCNIVKSYDVCHCF
jgi:hypothetical protein